MALLEVDHIVVDKKLWHHAKACVTSARESIRESVEGLEIYFHAMIRSNEFWDKNEVITLRELEEVCSPIYVFIKTSNAEIEWAQNYVSSGEFRKDLKKVNNDD